MPLNTSAISPERLTMQKVGRVEMRRADIQVPSRCGLQQLQQGHSALRRAYGLDALAVPRKLLGGWHPAELDCQFPELFQQSLVPLAEHLPLRLRAERKSCWSAGSSITLTT